MPGGSPYWGKNVVLVNCIIVHFDTLNLNCHLVAHSCSCQGDAEVV